MKKIILILMLLMSFELAYSQIGCNASSCQTFVNDSGLIRWFRLNDTYVIGPLNITDYALFKNLTAVHGLIKITDPYGITNGGINQTGLLPSNSTGQFNTTATEADIGFNDTTINMWIAPDNNSGLWNDDERRLYTCDTQWFIRFDNGGANLDFHKSAGTVSIPYSLLGNLFDDWMMMTFTVNGSSLKFYINGTLTETGSVNDAQLTACQLDFGFENNIVTTPNPFRGNRSDETIWDRALTSDELSCLYDGEFQDLTSCIQNSTHPISVKPSTVRFTSDGGQDCGFNTTGTYLDCGPTFDTTPTFTFNTFGRVGCKIWNESLNFTTLNISGVTNCSTAGPTGAHTCTFPTALSGTGIHTIYASCIDPLGNETNVLIDANTWNISISNATIFQDNIDAERLYELGTTTQLNVTGNPFVSLDYVCLNLSHPDFNGTCGPLPILFNYSQTDVYYNNFSDGRPKQNISPEANFNITIYEVELIGFRFNLSLATNPSIINLTINYTMNNTIILPGELNGSGDLLQNRFLVGDVNSNATNLTFTAAGTKIININASNQGNSNQSSIFNITFTGFDLDGGNEFLWNLITYAANESTPADTGSVKNGTAFPFGDFEDKPISNQTFETFVTNHTFLDRWKNPGGTIVWDINEVPEGRIESNSPSTNFYSDYIDLSTVDYVSFDSLLACYCGCSVDLDFTDLTDAVLIYQINQPTCPGTGVGVDARQNFTFKRLGNIWTVESTFFNGDIDVSSLETPYYIQVALGVTAANSITGSFYNFNYGGIYLNKTSHNISGVEGAEALPVTAEGTVHSGNFTSHVINNTASNVARATLTYFAFTPTGTSVTGYLSNDNGTTWEIPTNGTSHLFSSTGAHVRVRFHLTTIDNHTTPLVTDYTVQVKSTSLQNLSIDVGNDGNVDKEFNQFLNETTGPIVFDNETAFDLYRFNQCNGSSHCVIPVALSVGSGGLLMIDQLNYIQRINPIRPNETILNDLTQAYFTVNYTNGNLTVGPLDMRYLGDKATNLSVNISGTTIRQIFWRYSPFELNLPPTAQAWELFPNSRETNGTEPFGQNSTHGIWRVNSTLNHTNNGANIFARYNSSIDACVTNMTFKGVNNSNSTFNFTINLTTSTQPIIFNITSQDNDIYTFTDLECSNTTGPIFLPFFCFISLCGDCVETFDWNKTDACEVYV